VSNKYSLFLASLLIVALICTGLAVQAQDSTGPTTVYTLKVENTVSNGTARYIERGLELAERNQAEAVVILLDTPGGLVAATLDIIRAMSASRVPVITYVYPRGAIAASAGTFILLNGHIAAMSPQTTCGAAMPVTMSAPGGGVQAADQKTRNFLAGHMRSIARERGRPVDLAEQFVTKNLSLNNVEALEKQVIDLEASSIDQLLQRIDGKTVVLPVGKSLLHTAGARLVDIPVSLNEQLLGLVGDPSISMILLMLGIFALVLGLYSPGFFLPEILGSIGIILGLSGMGLFQGNLTAALLILLGAGLLVAELFTPTFGILGIGGLISVVLGILFFPVEPLMPAGWFAFFRNTALGVGIAGAIFVTIVAVGLARLRGRPPMQGESEYKNSIALALEDLNPQGHVRLAGETWLATVANGATVNRGEKVVVIKREGLLLTVIPIPDDRENSDDKEERP